MTHKLRTIAIAVASVSVPLVAFAQNGGTVTVAPLGAPAPALGAPLLGVLIVLLAVVGAIALRRARSVTAHVLVAVAVALTAAIGYAAGGVVMISADECNHITQKNFDSQSSVDLVSQCPNPIRILDIELHCDHIEKEEAPNESLPVEPCEIGQIIPPGGSCHLPICVC